MWVEVRPATCSVHTSPAAAGFRNRYAPMVQVVVSVILGRDAGVPVMRAVPSEPDEIAKPARKDWPSVRSLTRIRASPSNPVRSSVS